MIVEYNKALTKTNCHLEAIYNGTVNHESDFVVIDNFQVDVHVSEAVELDLSPTFVQINTQISCHLLQQNVLKILTESSLIYVETFWLISPTRSIFRNIEFCLCNSLLNTKTIVVEYFAKLVKQSFFQIKESAHLVKHYQEVFGYLEQIVIGRQYGRDTRDDEYFEKALCKLFDVLRETNAVSDNYTREKCRRICDIIISQKLRNAPLNSMEERLFMRATSELFIIVLEKSGEPFPNPSFLISFVENNKCCGNVQIILQFQIVKEFRMYFKETGNRRIDALVVSPTWKIIYGIICGELDACIAERKPVKFIYETLLFFKSVAKTAQIVFCMFREWYVQKQLNSEEYVDSLVVAFFTIQEVLLKLKKIISIYKINTSDETQFCLDAVVDVLSCVILFANCENVPQKCQEFKCMVEMICYPFCNIKTLNLPSVKYLISNEQFFKGDKCLERQMKAIDILSICFVNMDGAHQKSLNIVVKWILDIFRYAVTVESLQKHAALLFLNAISTLTSVNDDQFYEIFKQLMLSRNTDVLRVLSKFLGKIVCVFLGSGHATIRPSVKLEHNELFLDVLCLQCDFNKTNGKLFCKHDRKQFAQAQFIVDKRNMERVNFSMILNIFSMQLDNEIKVNLIEQLPRFVEHLPGFNTIELTRKWLKFLEDEDKEVRQHFTQIIKPLIENCQNNESIKNEYKESMLDACLQALVDATQKYLRSGSLDLLETLLDTIKEVGCLSYPVVIRRTAKLIIFYLILSDTHLYLTAIDYLNRIAKCHHQSPNLIFTKFKKNYCQSIANLSGFVFISKGFNIVQSLDRIALAFEFRLKELLTRNSHHLIPYFIPMFLKVPDTRTILTDIANLMQVQPHELLLSNFSYIYSYMYLYEEPNMFSQSMSYIEKETKANISELKRRNIKVIHNELLLHVHDKSELVIKELFKLSQEESQSVSGSSKASSSTNKSSSSSSSMQQISDYLQPHFLGVLVYFDSKLISSAVDESVKIRVLKSLPKLMQLMGSKYITPLRHKVLATLRTALSLTEKVHLELTCNNWEAFVHCCDVDTLGSLLSTVFVSILPLLQMFPRKVNAIYRYLIVENNDKLKDYIEDLYFLIDIPKVDSDLKNVIRACVARNQTRSFKEHLVMYLKYINHENMEVRVYGLKALKYFLETKSAELEELISGNNGMDSIIVNIIDVLIAGMV